jgi:hypothetical protein
MGEIKNILEIDFDKCTFAEIESYQDKIRAFIGVLQDKEAEAAMAKHRLLAQPSPLPVPEEEEWYPHPSDEKYEYNPKTREVRSVIPELPPQPKEAPPKPAKPDPKIPPRQNGKTVAVPNRLYDVYTFISTKGLSYSEDIAKGTGKTETTSRNQAGELTQMGLIKKVGPGIFEPAPETNEGKPYIFSSEDCTAMVFIDIAQTYKRPFGKEIMAKKMKKSPNHVSGLISVTKRMGFIKQVGEDKYLPTDDPPPYKVKRIRLDDPMARVIEILDKFNKPMHYIDVTREAGIPYDTARSNLKKAVDQKKAQSINGENSGVFASIHYQRTLPL